MTGPRTLVVDCVTPTAVGRGEPTSGVVDHEVEHDELGLPFVGGRALRGLLRDAWLSMRPCFPALAGPAAMLLGVEAGEDEAILRIGDAVVDDATRSAVAAAVHGKRVSSAEVLAALTEVRHQTARRRDGAPVRTSLRATRAISSDVSLQAPLWWLCEPSSEALSVLALCALCTRRAGVHRTRGLGRVRLTLDGDLALTRDLARAAETSA